MNAPLRRPAFAVRRPRATLALTLTALLALPAGQALADGPSCGAVITSDTRLHRDLLDCPGDGLVIGAAGITLDLNGHTISGSGTGTGIDNSAGHDGVRIANGTVSSFSNGIVLVDADRSRVTALQVSGNALGGISLVEGSDHNRLDHNVVSGNGLDGIFVFGSDGNRIEHNTVTGGGSAGIALVDGSDDNAVTHNSLSRNALGIAVGASDRNRLAHNRLRDNAVLGIVLDAANATVVEKNSTSGSELFGILVTGGSQRTTLRKNTVVGNGDDGIVVDGGSAGTLLDRNRVS